TCALPIFPLRTDFLLLNHPHFPVWNIGSTLKNASCFFTPFSIFRNALIVPRRIALLHLRLQQGCDFAEQREIFFVDTVLRLPDDNQLSDEMMPPVEGHQHFGPSADPFPDQFAPGSRQTVQSLSEPDHRRMRTVTGMMKAHKLIAMGEVDADVTIRGDMLVQGFNHIPV